MYRGEEPDVDGAIYQQYRFANGYPGFMGSAGWFTYERRFVEWAEAKASSSTTRCRAISNAIRRSSTATTS